MIEGSERDSVRLARMIHNGEELLQIASTCGKERFLNEPLVNHAVRDCFKDFTEEAEVLVRALKRADPGTDWGTLAKLRQEAHHAYHALTHEDLWAFATKELPRYLGRLRRIRFRSERSFRPAARDRA